MKKLLSVGVVMLFLITACSGVQIVTQDGNNTLIKIAAMKLGGEFAKKYPGEVEKVNTFAEALEGGDISQSVYEVIKTYIVTKVSDDPVDQACFAELLSMIQVVPVEGTEVNFDAEKLEIALEGFLFGMNIASLGGR